MKKSIEKSKYIEAKGIYYATALKNIKKGGSLQAIFEAFTNSLEAINTKKRKNHTIDYEIVINIFFKVPKGGIPGIKDEIIEFDKIEIVDNGIGFDSENFKRFETLMDSRKGFKNRGTGRVQYLHAFKESKFISAYKDKSSKTGFKERRFTLSKAKVFLKNNAIIRVDADEKSSKSKDSYTKLIFRTLLLKDDKEFFKNLSIETIKEELIHHYIDSFCEKRDKLPKIIIKETVNNKLKQEIEIKKDDIPVIDKKELIFINYSKYENSKIVKTSSMEKFILKTFVIDSNRLDENAIKLVSKGEIAKKITLNNLNSKLEINNKRYLFLLSSKYIDDKDSDTRGNIKIIKRAEFIRESKAGRLDREEILLENIEKKINDSILKFYDEINERNERKEENINNLKNIFSLNEDIVSKITDSIKINDSNFLILKKIYQIGVDSKAKGDAKIIKQLAKLKDKLNSKDNSDKKLLNATKKFIATIPLRNQADLSQYIARRKIVLELFDDILNRELENIKENKPLREKFITDLIFKKYPEDIEENNLWLENREELIKENELLEISEDKIGYYILLKRSKFVNKLFIEKANLQN